MHFEYMNHCLKQLSNSYSPLVMRRALRYIHIETRSCFEANRTIVSRRANNILTAISLQCLKNIELKAAPVPQCRWQTTVILVESAQHKNMG